MVYGDYYAHYGAFAAVFLGLAMSGTVARRMLVARNLDKPFEDSPKSSGSRHDWSRCRSGFARRLGVHNVRARAESWTVSPQSLAQIAAIAPGACIESDDVSILLLSGRFGAET